MGHKRQTKAEEQQETGALVPTKGPVMTSPIVEEGDELGQDGVERVLEAEEDTKASDVREQGTLHHHRGPARSPVATPIVATVPTLTARTPTPVPCSRPARTASAAARSPRRRQHDEPATDLRRSRA